MFLSLVKYSTLIFCDELLALVMVLLWGRIADKLSPRTTTAVANLIVALALVLFVQMKAAYPGLLLVSTAIPLLLLRFMAADQCFDFPMRRSAFYSQSEQAVSRPCSVLPSTFSVSQQKKR